MVFWGIVVNGEWATEKDINIGKIFTCALGFK